MSVASRRSGAPPPPEGPDAHAAPAEARARAASDSGARGAPGSDPACGSAPPGQPETAPRCGAGSDPACSFFMLGRFTGRGTFTFAGARALGCAGAGGGGGGEGGGSGERARRESEGGMRGRGRGGTASRGTARRGERAREPCPSRGSRRGRPGRLGRSRGRGRRGPSHANASHHATRARQLQRTRRGRGGGVLRARSGCARRSVADPPTSWDDSSTGRLAPPTDSSASDPASCLNCITTHAGCRMPWVPRTTALPPARVVVVVRRQRRPRGLAGRAPSSRRRGARGVGRGVSARAPARLPSARAASCAAPRRATPRVVRAFESARRQPPGHPLHPRGAVPGRVEGPGRARRVGRRGRHPEPARRYRRGVGRRLPGEGDAGDGSLGRAWGGGDASPARDQEDDRRDRGWARRASDSDEPSEPSDPSAGAAWGDGGLGDRTLDDARGEAATPSGSGPGGEDKENRQGGREGAPIPVSPPPGVSDPPPRSFLTRTIPRENNHDRPGPPPRPNPRARTRGRPTGRSAANPPDARRRQPRPRPLKVGASPPPPGRKRRRRRPSSPPRKPRGFGGGDSRFRLRTRRVVRTPPPPRARGRLRPRSISTSRRSRARRGGGGGRFGLGGRGGFGFGAGFGFGRRALERGADAARAGEAADHLRGGGAGPPRRAEGVLRDRPKFSLRRKESGGSPAEGPGPDPRGRPTTRSGSGPRDEGGPRGKKRDRSSHSRRERRRVGGGRDAKPVRAGTKRGGAAAARALEDLSEDLSDPGSRRRRRRILIPADGSSSEDGGDEGAGVGEGVDDRRAVPTDARRSPSPRPNANTAAAEDDDADSFQGYDPMFFRDCPGDETRSGANRRGGERSHAREGIRARRAVGGANGGWRANSPGASGVFAERRSALVGGGSLRSDVSPPEGDGAGDARVAL